MGFAERANPNSWYKRKRRGEWKHSVVTPSLAGEANEPGEDGTERGLKCSRNSWLYVLLPWLLLGARDFRKYGISGMRGTGHQREWRQNKQLRKQQSQLLASRGRR